MTNERAGQGPALSEGLGVMARLANAWGQQLGLDASHVKPEMRLVADLNFDSLDLVDAVMAAEDEFALVIEDDDVMQCVTVADYVALVQRLLDTPSHAGFDA